MPTDKDEPPRLAWLWTNVVGLLEAHEEKYLEHCRHYALADAVKR